MKPSFTIPLFVKFARERGIEMRIEPSYRYVAQLTLPDGSKRYMSAHIDGINGAGATEIARDKTYALYFLQQMGYCVPEGRAFFSQSYAAYLGSDQRATAGWDYACQLGLPVILKPNSKSQGRGVWKIHSREEYDAAIRDLDSWVDIFRIERFVSGRDYRLVVYDGELVCAYERIPLNICGDGTSTISELLTQKNTELDTAGRTSVIDIRDRRIAWSLSRNHLSSESILEQGRMLMLLGNANCSSGGDIRDVTTIIHESYRKLAQQCSHDMGLTLCGMDLLVDGDASLENNATIIEVNAGPGLMHYASLGSEQQYRIEGMYRRMFERVITSDQ